MCHRLRKARAGPRKARASLRKARAGLRKARASLARPGPALVPLRDADLTVKELRRNAARGVRAVAFSELPAYLDPPSLHSRYWDPVRQMIRGAAPGPGLGHGGRGGAAPRRPGGRREHL